MEGFLSAIGLWCVITLLVFWIFRLYNSIWAFVSTPEVFRITGAYVVLGVIGVLVFHFDGNLMPRSSMVVGFLFSFVSTVAIRFSYRLLLMEKVRVANNGKGATINAMVIGAGGTGKIVLQELEREKTVRPVCALNYKEIGFGSLLDGVPVVNGVENLKGAIEKYRVNFVIIASAVMPQEVRNRIKAICREASVEVQDYSGFFQGFGGSVTLKNLAECADGKVELVVNGEHQQYADCEQALVNAAGKYVVKSISARADTLVIELTDHSVVQNDLNADWVKDQEKETGEAISFF